MRARDLASALPVVDRSMPAIDAVRLIAREDLLGVVIVDETGHPAELISTVDVARMMLPRYVRSDLSLANVLGEVGTDDLHDELHERTVGDLVDAEEVTTRRVLTVDGDAHLVEIAARLVDAGTQVALVHDNHRTEPGFVTLPAVLDAVVARWDQIAHTGEDGK